MLKSEKEYTAKYKNKKEEGPMLLYHALQRKVSGVTQSAFLTAANESSTILGPSGKPFRPSTTTFNGMISKNIYPAKMKQSDVKKWLLAGIEKQPYLVTWAEKQKYRLSILYALDAKGAAERSKPNRTKYTGQHFLNTEPIMITQEILKHFGLTANPFCDSLLNASDLWLSHSMQAALDAMHNAVQTGGLLGVISEVGSGKTVVRMKFYDDLAKDSSFQLITIKIVDKKGCTASHVCKAIVRDLTADEQPKSDKEEAARQVERLLKEKVAQGIRPVIVFEEAHDLTEEILRYLKRFHEIKEGFRPLFAIILVGQTELAARLRESGTYRLREFSRRLQRIEIRSLNGQMEEYLDYRFKLVNARVSQVFTEAALETIRTALKHKPTGTGKVLSKNYPLSVNNICTNCMATAHAIGEKIVTPEIVMEVQKEVPKW